MLPAGKMRRDTHSHSSASLLYQEFKRQQWNLIVRRQYLLFEPSARTANKSEGNCELADRKNRLRNQLIRLLWGYGRLPFRVGACFSGTCETPGELTPREPFLALDQPTDREECIPNTTESLNQGIRP